MNNNQRKPGVKDVLVIHHKSDNDGILSAALIINYLFSNKHNRIHTWGVDYDELNNLWKQGVEAMTEKFQKYDGIFITDMSFNDPAAMQWMHDNVDNLYWFDHHKPIIEASKDKFDDIQGIRNTEQSAILCVYQFIYDPELTHVPKILQELSDYDSWQWVNKDYEEDYIMAVNTGFTFLSNLSINFWLQNIDNILTENYKQLHKDALDKGKTIEKYTSEKYERMLKISDKTWNAGGEKAVVVFGDNARTSIYKSLRNTDVVHGISFKRLENGNWKVGLYNINDDCEFDCGQYLKEKYQGGGHKGAAGCVIEEDKFIEILKNKSL